MFIYYKYTTPLKKENRLWHILGNTQYHHQRSSVESPMITSTSTNGLMKPKGGMPTSITECLDTTLKVSLSVKKYSVCPLRTVTGKPFILVTSENNTSEKIAITTSQPQKNGLRVFYQRKNPFG